MKTKLAIALFLVSAGLCPAQDTPAETLRKGIIQEESNNNLDAAVKAYQAVLSAFDQGRETAATALFRLAEAYRKMGKPEQARQLYLRLVREFPEQSKLAAQSRAQLPSSEPSVPPAELAALMKKLEAVHAQLQVAKKSLDRTQSDYNLGAVDAEAVRAAEFRYLEQQARLADAERDFARAKAALAN